MNKTFFISTAIFLAASFSANENSSGASVGKQRLTVASRQMLASLREAEYLAAEHPGNGSLILASALCGLWQSYPQPEQRKTLVSQAEYLAAEHPGNGSLIISAAYGRCPR